METCAPAQYLSLSLPVCGRLSLLGSTNACVHPEVEAFPDSKGRWLNRVYYPNENIELAASTFQPLYLSVPYACAETNVGGTPEVMRK